MNKHHILSATIMTKSKIEVFLLFSGVLVILYHIDCGRNFAEDRVPMMTKSKFLISTAAGKRL